MVHITDIAVRYPGENRTGGRGMHIEPTRSLCGNELASDVVQRLLQGDRRPKVGWVRYHHIRKAERPPLRESLPAPCCAVIERTYSMTSLIDPMERTSAPTGGEGTLLFFLVYRNGVARSGSSEINGADTLSGVRSGVGPERGAPGMPACNSRALSNRDPGVMVAVCWTMRT